VRANATTPAWSRGRWREVFHLSIAEGDDRAAREYAFDLADVGSFPEEYPTGADLDLGRGRADSLKLPSGAPGEQ
jgi:hypothetical protein